MLVLAGGSLSDEKSVMRAEIQMGEDGSQKGVIICYAGNKTVSLYFDKVK